MIQSVAVFCGSSAGRNLFYTEKAKALGALLAERDLELVYGAGNIGLMGAIAEGALQAGGRVVGSIPHFIVEKEVCHTGLTELFTTETMHERKQIMAERADAFLVLPGGFGTLDEFFEILTWKQLHLHAKPIGLLNWRGYFDHLLAMVDHMVKEGFLHPVNRDLIVTHSDAGHLLDNLHEAPPPADEKWVDRT